MVANGSVQVDDACLWNRHWRNVAGHSTCVEGCIAGFVHRSGHLYFIHLVEAVI